MGEMAVEVLKSANLSAAKIENEGYSFLYPDINIAAKELSDVENPDCFIALNYFRET